MKATTQDPWTRDWQIVSAQLDIAHVMLPLSSFRLDIKNPGEASPLYRIAYNTQAPTPDCFAGTELAPVAGEEVTFYRITKRERLPSYAPDADTVSEYSAIADMMSAFMQKNRSVSRLEGTIRIPCHAHGTDVRQGRAPHSPLSFETTVHFYRFDRVVDGKLPLLVVRTPLSPLCPWNADGTAMGLGKN